MQYRFQNGDKVDAVIKAKEGMIPIDAKFPLENYQSMINADDDTTRSRFEAAFKGDLRKHISDTAKYILPREGTVDFAFMFIPAEGIFYDLLVNKIGGKSPIDYALKEKVFIVSPTTFAAYLQTVLYGYRAFRVEEKAEEIRRNVDSLRENLNRYEESFRRVGNSLSATVNNYNTAYRELRRVDKDIFDITDKRIGIEPIVVDRPQAAE
jgi:DNA recombination protein RmuC